MDTAEGADSSLLLIWVVKVSQRATIFSDYTKLWFNQLIKKKQKQSNNWEKTLEDLKC